MSRQGLPLRSAPIIHLAMMIGSLLVVGVFWYLRGGVPMVLLPASRRVLSWIGYGAAAAVLVATTIIKSRVSVLERGNDVTEWWSANGTNVLLLWILGEAACGGAVLWFLTDNQLVLLSLSGAGLLILAAYRPSKLMSNI